MKPTPEIEAQGLRAYEKVVAFEQLQRRRLPMIYVSLATVWIIGGLWAFGIAHTAYTASILIGGILFTVGTRVHWLRLKDDYHRNLALVKDLEQTYGDALSWVQVEKHFAELEKIQQEEKDSRKG